VDGLLEFLEVLEQDQVAEGVDEGGQELDVAGEGGDAVGVYGADVWGEGEVLLWWWEISCWLEGRGLGGERR